MQASQVITLIAAGLTMMASPIRAISDETRHMTLLERDARCKIKSKDEFGELAANVNGLYENLLGTIDNLEAELEKVAAVEQAKTDFLRAASHELKTPVTAVSVVMDNMILGIGKYKNHEEWLPKCKELVDSLSDMLREILDASRLNDITEEGVTESIESICTEIIEPYIMQYKTVADGKVQYGRHLGSDKNVRRQSRLVLPTIPDYGYLRKQRNGNF